MACYANGMLTKSKNGAGKQRTCVITSAQTDVRNPEPGSTLPGTPCTLINRNLGGNKRLRVVSVDGEQYVDIVTQRHDGYESSSAGVSLPLDRYVAFRNIMPDITKLLKQIVKKREVNHFKHIGGNLHVHIRSPYTQVNIRQHCRIKVGENMRSELLPVREIFLKLEEWNELCKVDASLNDTIPTLKTLRKCNCSGLDETNRLARVFCFECNPAGLFREPRELSKLV